MPITREWLDQDKTILYLRLQGKLKAEDFFDSDDKTIAMLDSVDHPVDLIVDYTGQHFFTPDYVQTSDQMTLIHKNMRLVIFLGNKLAWELFDLYSRRYDKALSFSYTYAQTLEQALEIINDIRAGKRPISYRPDSPDWN